MTSSDICILEGGSGENQSIFTSDEKQTYQKKSFRRHRNGAYNQSIYKKFQKKKYRWHDGRGRQLTAGGILPYDDNGIWVIEENSRNGDIEWTDTGGKYRFEDCDIYTTIAREFSEEVYHSCNLSRSDVVDIAATHTPTYVNGHQNLPVYICYAVHANVLLKYGVNMSPAMFTKSRQKAILSNPDVPENYYSSINLRYIPFPELDLAMRAMDPLHRTFSYRLKRILRHGPLASRLYSIGNRCSLENMTKENFVKETSSD